MNLFAQVLYRIWFLTMLLVISVLSVWLLILPALFAGSLVAGLVERL